MICPGRGKIYLICYVILCFTHFLLISWPGFSQYFHVWNHIFRWTYSQQLAFKAYLYRNSAQESPMRKGSTTGGFTNEPLVEHPNLRFFTLKSPSFNVVLWSWSVVHACYSFLKLGEQTSMSSDHKTRKKTALWFTVVNGQRMNAQRKSTQLQPQPFAWAPGLCTWNTLEEDHWWHGGYSHLCPLSSWNKPSLRCFTQLQSMQSRQGNRKKTMTRHVRKAQMGCIHTLQKHAALFFGVQLV